jgi:hypothetical protein
VGALSGYSSEEEGAGRARESGRNVVDIPEGKENVDNKTLDLPVVKDSIRTLRAEKAR